MIRNSGENGDAITGDGSSTDQSTLTIANSIVPENSGGNLGGYLSTIILGQNILSGDPTLGPLADDSGPTRKHKPLPGSPAIGSGINAVSLDANGATLATDQRGRPRSPFGSTIAPWKE